MFILNNVVIVSFSGQIRKTQVGGINDFKHLHWYNDKRREKCLLSIRGQEKGMSLLL